MGVQFLLVVAALGVAGFDPFGALLVAGALALGASRTSALAFLLASSVVQLGLALAAGRMLGPFLDAVESRLVLLASIWSLASLAVGAGLIGWGLVRVRRGAVVRPERPPRGVSSTSMAVAGLWFGFTVLLDPAYYAVVAVVARNAEPVARLTALVVWFAIAQWLLIALVIAAWVGDAGRAAEWLRGLWRRSAPVLARAINIAALVAGVALVVDGIWYLVTGRFLVG